MIKDKLIIALLGIILVTMVFNTFHSCGQNNKLESIYQKQIEEKEELSKQIEQIAKSRIDSTFIIERTIEKRKEEKKERQNEVYNATNIDSVLKLYYYWRPDKVDTTH